jgi:hypothetical protein
MSTGHRLTRGAAALVACAAAILLASPALADASSKGFDVYSLTGSSITLKSVDIFGGEPFEEVNGKVGKGPRPGLVLKPGGAPLHVELKYSQTAIYRADLVHERPRWQLHRVSGQLPRQ